MKRKKQPKFDPEEDAWLLERNREETRRLLARMEDHIPEDADPRKAEHFRALFRIGCAEAVKNPREARFTTKDAIALALAHFGGPPGWEEWEDEKQAWREEMNWMRENYERRMNFAYREAEYVAGRCRHVDDPLFGKPVENPVLLADLEKTR